MPGVLFYRTTPLDNKELDIVIDANRSAVCEHKRCVTFDFPDVGSARVGECGSRGTNRSFKVDGDASKGRIEQASIHIDSNLACRIEGD